MDLRASEADIHRVRYKSMPSRLKDRVLGWPPIIGPNVTEPLGTGMVGQQMNPESANNIMRRVADTIEDYEEEVMDREMKRTKTDFGRHPERIRFLSLRSTDGAVRADIRYEKSFPFDDVLPPNSRMNKYIGNIEVEVFLGSEDETFEDMLERGDRGQITAADFDNRSSGLSQEYRDLQRLVDRSLYGSIKGRCLGFLDDYEPLV